MLPKYHILFGFLFSLILFLVFPFIGLLGFLIIFASSVLIDVDHYIYFVFVKKNFSLGEAYKYFFEKRKKYISSVNSEKERSNLAMYLLHGIEILLIIFILGIFVNKIFLFIFIGFSFHLFLDIIELIYYGFRIVKVSLIWDLVRLKTNLRD